jgi:hypothetical protein
VESLQCGLCGLRQNSTGLQVFSFALHYFRLRFLKRALDARERANLIDGGHFFCPLKLTCELGSVAMLPISILAAILTLMPAPSPKWGETQAEFKTRMELVSAAIAKASNDVAKPEHRRAMAMALVVTFWGESRFSPLIQAGQHRGDGGHALCLGQLHQGNLTREEWLGVAGLDLESTTRCATVVAQRLKGAWWYCHGLDTKNSWPAALVLYGSGRTCHAEETAWKNIFVDRAAKLDTLLAAR